ncbi:hypothetical protein [Massilia sp. Leaf139]|uniref:hypothetical protein n=1 Tax=Massilia sp. Leaf139 TaxID=1736272 RepID=UPI0006FC1CCE|nr:hypothetical protein [Massilia sp. Leaf139]KQQ88956.1 hypothetical protein ASF77_09600 [Massilia sp. Leaf139]
MKSTNTLPGVVLTAAFLAAMLGACTKKDSGVGGSGDAAHVAERSTGEGAGSSAGVSGATGNSGNAGLSSTEYNTNVTPRTVGEAESTKKDSLGASGGASGVDGVRPVDSSGNTTGGANPGGAPMQSAPAAGTKSTGHTGNTTGTGPGSTRPGAGGEGSIH